MQLNIVSLIWVFLYVIRYNIQAGLLVFDGLGMCDGDWGQN